jgi:hypothetical protein
MLPHFMVNTPRIFAEKEIVPPLFIGNILRFLWPLDMRFSGVAKLFLLTCFPTVRTVYL